MTAAPAPQLDRVGPPEIGYGLAGSAQSPAQARTLIREALDDFAQESVDTAELLVSVLVTNAVLHTRSLLTLHIEVSHPHLRVSVEDTSPAPPKLGDVDPYAAGGRGMALVHALASSWGWALTATGKYVWFEF
jgi:hypothetical protein